MSRTLQIEVRINAPSIEEGEFHKAIDAELKGYEKWMIERNTSVGWGASPLTAPERLSVRAYLIYALTRDRVEA